MGTATTHYAPRRTAQQWQALFADWAASGLSQRSFCEAKGIKYGTFTQRRRALQAPGAAAQRRPATAAPKLIELTLPAQPPEPPLTSKLSSPTTTGRWDLELELGPGLILRLQQR